MGWFLELTESGNGDGEIFGYRGSRVVELEDLDFSGCDFQALFEVFEPFKTRSLAGPIFHELVVESGAGEDPVW